MITRNLISISTGIFLLIFTFSTTNLFSQAKTNSSAKVLLQELKKFEKSGNKEHFNQISREYEFIKINNEYHGIR
jgi:hypothetical protein